LKIKPDGTAKRCKLRVFVSQYKFTKIQKFFMSPASVELRDRTKAFAIRIVKLYRSLPHTADSQVVGKQLLRCGTSVAANYRAACRGRSRAEWLAKIGLVVEEADESVFWLEMLSDCGIVSSQRCEDILNEAHELSAIFTASQHTARRTTG
jgi:four helix bundle protein